MFRKQTGWILSHCGLTNRTELRPEAGDTEETLRVGFEALSRLIAQSSSGAAASDAPLASGAKKEQEEGKWLSEAITEWSQWNLVTGKWIATTWTQTYEPALRVFRELISDRRRDTPRTEDASSVCALWDIRVDEITRGKISEYGRQMLAYPDRQGQRRRLTDARQVLASGGKPQTRKNAFKAIGLVSTFLRWAYSKDYVAEGVVKEADLLNSAADRRDGLDGYRAYSAEHLKTLFESDHYRSDAFDRSFQYWSPLIALFTGMRLHEIAALTVEDFVVVEGLRCVRVSDAPPTTNPVEAPRRIKTSAARRIVPLHPRLQALGLLEFVERRRAGGESWLFDGLLYAEKGGRGRYIGEWFAGYAKALGVHEHRKLVFHSFRSNFAQAMEAAGLEASLVDATIGHAPKSTRGRHYSKGFDGTRHAPIRRIAEVLQSVDFGVAFQNSLKWGA